MTMFAFRALLTFSRGGVITAAIILLIVAIFLGGKSLLKPANFFRTIFLTVGVSLIFWFTFQYTNSLTGEALYKRYAGIREDKQVESLEEINSVKVAAHNEFTRLLAEHGAFGLVALGILILMPINRFFKSRSLLQRVVMLVGIGFCFVFMSHSATRLAAPGFLYGMSFILFVNSSARSSKRTEPLEKNHEVVNADTASN